MLVGVFHQSFTLQLAHLDKAPDGLPVGRHNVLLVGVHDVDALGLAEKVLQA